MWEACMSDEDEKEEFDYHYFEDEPTLTVRKHKKRRPLLEKKEEDGFETRETGHLNLNDALVYREEIVFHQNKGDYRPAGDDYVTYVLASCNDVIPFGYPTEQFMTWMKNDVHDKFEESRKARKDALARMKREAMDGGGQMKENQVPKEQDTGRIDNFSGKTQTFEFSMLTAEATSVRTKAKLVDTHYNALRALQRDATNLRLRPEMVST